MQKLRQAPLLLAIAVVSIVLIAVGIYAPDWLYSLATAALSYILVMLASLLSISRKLTYKIEKATQEAKLEEEQESKEKTDSKEKRFKRILRFLDLSKVSLGFELSFSLARSIAFLIMCGGLGGLIYYGVFYLIAYLAGIFCGVALVVGYLFSQYDNKGDI